MGANVSSVNVQQALAALATSPTVDPGMRYTALRQLEVGAPAASVPVAESLASDPSATLRANAVAVLARSKTPEGRAALARVTAASPSAATLAAQIQGGH